MATLHIPRRHLIRRVSLVEQELLTLPEHLSSPPVFSGVRVTRSLVLYVCFVDRYLSFCTFVICPFVLFLLAIVLSVLLRYMDSDCPFGIFKLFLSHDQYHFYFMMSMIRKVMQHFQKIASRNELHV